MSISTKNLDSLLNASFPLTDYSGVNLNSYAVTTTDATAYPPPMMLGESLTTTTGSGLPGQSPGATATIEKVDDAVNSLTVQTFFNGASTGTVTEYVISFYPTALLISSSNSATLAEELDSGTTLKTVASSLVLLADAPIKAGTTIYTTLDATFTDPVPCFARGTRLETATGSRAVEELAVGDVVRAHHFGWVPVRWIGRARVDCRRHSQPDDVTPIRVRAGAFGPEMPSRDVLLSPGHAVFANDRLISVRHLVNGATIVREPEVGLVDYFHVELADHDVLFADGLPVESFLDDGSGAYLEGRAERLLRPDHVTKTWADACAPKCEGGPILNAVRQALRTRALEVGYRLAPGRFDLWAGPTRLAPRSVDGRRWRFTIPAGATEVRLCSARNLAASVLEDCRDERRLGVCVGAVRLGRKTIALDSPMLASGFDRLERDAGDAWRWTDGAGLFRLPPSRRARTLELLVVDVLPNWTRPEEASAAKMAA